MGTTLTITGILFTGTAAAGSQYSVMTVSGSAPYGGVRPGPVAFGARTTLAEPYQAIAMP
jgi:hypothetical protein